MVQWMADFYSTNDDEKSSDLNKYWNQIILISKEDKKLENLDRLNLVTITSTQWVVDDVEDSHFVTKLRKR